MRFLDVLFPISVVAVVSAVAFLCAAVERFVPRGK